MQIKKPSKFKLPLVLKILLPILAVVIVVAFILSRISISDYVILPGQAFSVEQLIGLPKKYDLHNQGKVDMVDVMLMPLNALNYPYYAWLDGNDQIYPSQQVLDSSTPVQYQEQGVIDMYNARQAATYVALREMGYHVKAIPAGVFVYNPLPGSPAAAHLADNDIISTINGYKITTFASISSALGGKTPGSPVYVGVHQFGSRKERNITFRLGIYRVTKFSSSGVAEDARCLSLSVASKEPPFMSHGKPLGCLGLAYAPYLGGSEPYYRLSGLPFRIDLSAEGIIGPSAGLAFTLGLLDRLDNGNLIKDNKVAATGTMSINGAIGPIGGVKEKTVAVEDAGDKIFFVPQANLASAQSKNNGSLTIIGVSNIKEVIHKLETLGGKLNLVHGK